MRFVLTLPFLLFLFACAGAPPADKPEKKAPLVLKPASYEALPGWEQENYEGIRDAMNTSCTRIYKRDPTASFGPDPRWGTYAQWQETCRVLETISSANLRGFFETHFQPYQALAGSDSDGLFTGYYEASLRGSRTRSGVYRYALRARPEDLVMVDLGEFREHLKGERIAGRVVKGSLKPYEDRAAIEAGKLPDAQDKTLLWVDNAVDAFFVQIQGSGVVMLDDGSAVRVGYAGQNGHPYYAIGRELVKRGELSKDDVSLQSIRAWLETHPDDAAEIMNTNPSYVFFQEVAQGPLGGEGVKLTPERSLAIDRTLIPYGVPVWLDAEHPDPSHLPLRRMMVTQDTGGAITGPVRGDFFWGYGPQAESLAGPMKSEGRYWFLLPRTVTN